ncbi:MAG: hypothetical protein JSS11_14890 [Verrucomicrobia bacterium]|nr:hypothetical protein [Verrucomicrobiota bacterium]
MSQLNFARSTLFAPLFAVALLGVPVALPAADNPFAPAPSAGGPGAGPVSDTYQLSGYVAQPKGDGMISVTRTSDKRSLWIPLGQTVGDITAVSYDALNDQAVIKAGGQTLTITLRKAVVKAGTNIIRSAAPPPPMPAPVAAAPASGAPAAPGTTPAADPTLPPQPPPPAPGTDAFKEQEARMLVTDLLEIGLEQRKAYEAAQREAAARGGRAGQADPATATATTSPTR